MVHEEVIDLVKVVRLLQEQDYSHLVETRYFHSISGYFFYHNRLGTRVSKSLLYNQRESALSVVPRESWFAHFLSRDVDFPWRLKWRIQTHRNKSSCSDMTDWQRLTWQQAVVRRVIKACLRPGGSSRSWVNCGEESALPMVSSSVSRSCKYEGLVSLEDSWRKIPVVPEKG